MTPLYQLPRLHHPGALAAGAGVALPKAASHYLTRVMRRKEGDAVLLFNAADGEWLARIAHSGKDAVQLVPERRLRPFSPEPDLWLVFAPLKQGPMEFLVEKATELGVGRLLPVLTRRSVVNRINPARIEAHAVEAAEQSERLSIPALDALIPLEKRLENWPEERILLVADESGQGPPVAECAAGLPPERPLALLTGPEGGFTPDELAMLARHPACRGVSLGPRILRAETAALAGLACLQAIWGDWRQRPTHRMLETL